MHTNTYTPLTEAAQKQMILIHEATGFPINESIKLFLGDKEAFSQKLRQAKQIAKACA